MAIKKVIDPEEFKKAWLDLDELFKDENSQYGHQFYKISAQNIINSWANASLLNNTMHTWVNFENDKADAIIMFIDHINTICGKRMWQEYFWISKNSKASLQLLRKALKFASSKGIEFMIIGCVEKHPKSNRVKELYKKLGFTKDSETYIKKL